MGVLAWMGASGAQLQLQSALSARHTRHRHAPDIQALTIALCCFRCESGKTGKRAQRPIQRCCHFAAAVNQAPSCVPSR